MKQIRIVLPTGHDWSVVRDELTVTEFVCRECSQTFVHYPATNTHTSPESIKPHGHKPAAMSRLYEGLTPSRKEAIRCDACDILMAGRRRVRVHLTCYMPKAARSSGMLMCPECARYLIRAGTVTKTLTPKGLRKAGNGEFARCSRFAD